VRLRKPALAHVACSLESNAEIGSKMMVVAASIDWIPAAATM
jgi:hypothetical protein